MELITQSLGFSDLLPDSQRLTQLREQGLVFATPKRSWLRWFGQAERSWHVQQPYLGTLPYLVQELAQLRLSDRAVQLTDTDTLLVDIDPQQALRCARILAIASLNGFWGIQLLTRPLAYFFRQHLSHTVLIQLTGMVSQLMNLPALVASVQAMRIAPAPTMPTPKQVMA